MSITSFNHSWTVRPKVSPYAQLQGAPTAGEPVTLPHDAIIGQPRSAAETVGGRNGYFPGGVFEYSKTFDVPEHYRTKVVRLEFQGVYRDAMVYVNGTFAAQRPSGYATFVVDLNPFLRYGEQNTIRVDARAHDDSRWYTGTGIYRDTRLIVSDLTHIPHDRIRITTPDIDTDRAVVEVVTPINNDSLHTVTRIVDTVIVDPDGVVVAEASSPSTVRSREGALVRQRLFVQAPSLWSPDSPSLYMVRSVLRDGTDVLDTHETTLGIRTLQLDPLKGLRINGETVKLRGACIHHDNGPLGSATIARAEERRVELLKEAGFNAIRSSHNPMSQAMLDACDRLGMLVMDETFDMWTEGKSPYDYSLAFAEWWERDVESLVAKNYNHPSVVFYSIGNEILETGDPLGSTWGRHLAEKIRSLDSTRFVTNGINGFVSVLQDVVQMMQANASQAGGDGQETGGGVNDLMNSAADFMNQVSASPLVTEKTEESFALLDVAGLNYGDSRYLIDKDLFPDRIIVGSETFPPGIARYWRLVEDNAHIIGDFTWTGWDYLGEVGIGRVQYADEAPVFEAPYPWITAWSGDHDITGHRRPISYYRETVYGLRHSPYIAVFRPENHGRAVRPGMWAWSDTESSWTWNVADGTATSVEVYSDADEIELIVNGTSLGKKPAGRDHAFMATFDATYARGDVTAIAYVNGEETARTTLHTAQDDVRLAIDVDRSVIRADDTDLAYVTIHLTDENGVIHPGADRDVHVVVTGPGVLQALGSARPDNDQPYGGTSHRTYQGRALALVRPTGAGTVTITVSADGLGERRVDVIAADQEDRSAADSSGENGSSDGAAVAGTGEVDVH